MVSLNSSGILKFIVWIWIGIKVFNVLKYVAYDFIYSPALYARLAHPIVGPESLRILLSLPYISSKE